MDMDNNSFNDMSQSQPKVTEVNPPEPKSRSLSAHISTIVMSSNPTDDYSSTSNNEEFLASVFEGIKLPDVSYSQDPQRAIKQIDDVLASEADDDHYDDSALFVNEYNHSSTTAYHLAVNVNNSNTATNGIEKHMVPGEDYQHCEGYSESELLRLPDRFEESDVRLRSMTVDSSISHCESRIGGFDVHNDNGNFTAEEINLHHDEVAYIRPKEGVSSPSDPFKSMMSEMEETLKLRQLNDEVAAAQERQRVLTIQVERERAEVERLRLLKQQNLDKGPVAADGNEISIHSNSGSFRDGSVKMVISPSPYHRSSIGSIYEEETVKISPVAEQQLKNANSICTIDNVDMVVPECGIVRGFSSNPHINKVIFGGHQTPTDEDKVVLLLGPIGSGKTSTINSMLNYLYDVKKENNFRFVVDYPVKKTTTLTVYVFNNSILPFRITVVDTPGIDDEQGNRTVSTLIRKWFEKELRDHGTFRLDAISLVLKHDENFLGWPFIHELSNVKHMFGGDLKTNVLPIITNTEVLPEPLAIRSLAQANIEFLGYYKCNNLGFTPYVDGITKLHYNLFFTHGIASFEAYFRDLQELIHPLLAVMRNGEHSFLQSACY